jgi:hypothetical protein
MLNFLITTISLDLYLPHPYSRTSTRPLLCHSCFLGIVDPRLAVCVVRSEWNHGSDQDVLMLLLSVACLPSHQELPRHSACAMECPHQSSPSTTVGCLLICPKMRHWRCALWSLGSPSISSVAAWAPAARGVPAFTGRLRDVVALCSDQPKA